MKYASKMKQQWQQLNLSLCQSQKGTQSTDTTWTEDLKIADPPTGITLASTSTTSATLTQCIF